MSALQAQVQMSDIERVVGQIVSRFHPRKVILFGSYAYGQPTADSDVDLLVLMETNEAPLWAAAHVSAAIDHPFPLDILVQRPADWQAHLADRNVFETVVATEGLTLYEAEDFGVDREGRG